MTNTIKILFLVLVASLFIAFFWDHVPAIKNSVHSILDPSAGKLIGYNAWLGMIVIAAIISLAITLIQKYTTDQKLLKQIKKEQKILQEEMKKFKDNPTKLIELQKKQLQFIPKTLDITIRPLIYTSVPIILFFRWFNDYFVANPYKFLGFSWIWAYIILSIIFSSIFRRVFDVA